MNRDHVKLWGGRSLKIGLAVLVLAAAAGGMEIYQVNSSRIEAALHPVVENWRFDEWALDTDSRYWSVHARGNKVRPECIYDRDQSPVVLVTTAFTPEGKEIPLDYATPLPRGASRPPGEQDFGRWIIRSRAVNKGDKVTFAFRHRCHDGHPVTSVVGPIWVGFNSPENANEDPAVAGSRVP